VDTPRSRNCIHIEDDLESKFGARPPALRLPFAPTRCHSGIEIYALVTWTLKSLAAQVHTTESSMTQRLRALTVNRVPAQS